MSWSLNEIEALAKKAARGSGLSWGLAEETGKATRWLCAMGLPGAEALADLLVRNDNAAYDTLCPQDISGDWTATSGTLCPLIAGAALCDLASDLANGRQISMGCTAYPLFLFPFVAAAADMTGSGLSVHWSGVTMSRSDGLSYIDSNGEDTLLIAAAQSVRIADAPTASGRPVHRKYRGKIGPDAFETLGRFAHRTYAPDTPESRLAGAGAGLTDND